MNKSPHQLILLGVMAMALAVFFFYRWQAMEGPEPFLGEAGAHGEVLHVKVVGDMVVPGVYEMPPGSRLADLLEQASFQGTVDDLPELERNFPLLDGNLFEVRRGEDGRLEVRRGTLAGQMLTLFFTPIDINRASAKDLEALPGVGAATAQAIVRYREAHGPFATVDDLTGVKGIGPKTVEKLRDQVYVGERPAP